MVKQAQPSLWETREMLLEGKPCLWWENTQNETFVGDIIILERFSTALVGTDMTMRKCCDTCASQCTCSGSTCHAPNPRMKEQKVASLKNSMETATKESRYIVTRYSSSSLRILLTMERILNGPTSTASYSTKGSVLFYSEVPRSSNKHFETVSVSNNKSWLNTWKLWLVEIKLHVQSVSLFSLLVTVNQSQGRMPLHRWRNVLIRIAGH